MSAASTGATKAGRCVGVLGGSFDPPHLGHVLLAAYALSAADLDALLVIPTFEHPFGKPLSDFQERVRMAELAFGVVRGAEVSRIEEALGGASYTVRTLEALRDKEPDARFRLVIGADVIADAPRWKDWDKICALAPPFVAGRAGHGAGSVELTLPQVSSTEVRRRLDAGESIEGLLPSSVSAHIRERSLYAARRPKP